MKSADHDIAVIWLNIQCSVEKTSQHNQTRRQTDDSQEEMPQHRETKLYRCSQLSNVSFAIVTGCICRTRCLRVITVNSKR